MGCCPHTLPQECHEGKKRSHKNVLNNKGPSIDPWDTPNKMSIHSL